MSDSIEINNIYTAYANVSSRTTSISYFGHSKEDEEKQKWKNEHVYERKMLVEKQTKYTSKFGKAGIYKGASGSISFSGFDLANGRDYTTATSVCYSGSTNLYELIGQYK